MLAATLAVLPSWLMPGIERPLRARSPAIEWEGRMDRQPAGLWPGFLWR